MMTPFVRTYSKVVKSIRSRKENKVLRLKTVELTMHKTLQNNILFSNTAYRKFVMDVKKNFMSTNLATCNLNLNLV